MIIKKKYFCKECKIYHILQTKIGKNHLHNIDLKHPKLLTNDEINDLYLITETEDYRLFMNYSHRWNAGIDPSGRDMAIYLANSNNKLKQYLHFRHFGKKIPKKVTLYRVGNTNNLFEWSSFWTTLRSARAYERRMGGNIINKYRGSINNIIPSLSGAGEIYAKNVELIKRNI